MSDGPQKMWEELYPRIRAELLRDKKKTAIMGILIVVAMVFGLKELTSSAPESAKAYMVATAGSGSQETSVKPPLEEEFSGESYLMKDDSWEREVSISRDIFSANPNFFPLEEGNSSVSVVSQENTEELKQQERQAFAKMIEGQANSLSIQSTIISNNPAVMINGRLLRIGEEINGFIVEKITPRSCTVSKAEVKILLEMPN